MMTHDLRCIYAEAQGLLKHFEGQRLHDQELRIEIDHETSITLLGRRDHNNPDRLEINSTARITIMYYPDESMLFSIREGTTALEASYDREGIHVLPCSIGGSQERMVNLALHTLYRKIAVTRKSQEHRS